MVDGGLFEGELRLADGFNDRIDEGDDLLVGLVSQLNAAEQDVLGDFLGFGLDHDDLLRGGGDRAEHQRRSALLAGRVDDILAVEIGDLGRGHRAVPGHGGAGGGDEGAQRGDDLDGGFMVGGQGGGGDDDVVAELIVEEGAHRAVDQAHGQDGLFGGTALAAVEGAGNAADAVEALFKLNGQREVVHAGLGDGVAGDGREDHGVAVAADALGVGQLGNLAGLDGKGSAADLGLKNVMVGVLFSGDHENLLVFTVHRRFRT